MTAAATPAAPERSLPAIHSVELAKRFGDVEALAGLTMSVPRGEIFGFLGPNGAGKTTAVKLMLGLTYPTSGEAFVLGAPIGDRAVKRRLGYLPELFRYQDWLAAAEVLDFHAGLIGLPRSGRADTIAAVLDLVGLAKRAADRVGTYSKGMQQRLGLAVALLGDPSLVFLDEPTSALDPVGRHEVREILHGLKRRGVTVFLNSHLLTEVEHVCDRAAIVDRGRVIAIGPLATLMEEGFAVRVTVREATAEAAAALAAFGRVQTLASGYVVRDLERDRVPDLVAALVASGARVEAVEPARTSLEEHFLKLLHGSADAAARDR